MLDTNTMKRSELIPLLAAAAVKIALKLGKEQKISGARGTVHLAEVGKMIVVYRTPKALAFESSTVFCIDVWSGKKRFSVGWNSQVLKDYEIINFERGPWIQTLLALSEKLGE